MLILLGAVQRSDAQISPSHFENAGIARPQSDWLPFTRTVIITIEEGSLSAPALTSYWQTSIAEFSSTGGWDKWSAPLPSDATDVTATVTGGTYQMASGAIEFSFTSPVVHFGWAYRTNQKVLRQGNQYRIDQYASVNQNRPFFYVGTIFFTSPYQYVGDIGPAPASTGTALHWQEFVPLNVPPDLHKFSSSVWLVDPRLDQPDLRIVDSSVIANTLTGIAHITARIQNADTMTTGAPVYIDLYERSVPSLPPAGPLDMAGGWCSLSVLLEPDCPAFDSTLGVTNVLPVLGPLQIITMTADLRLSQPGRRDLYMQVDVFGSTSGLNRESNEANNLKYLGQVTSPYRVYLPAVLKGQ